MLLLRCPYCDELRSEVELTCGGEADIARPADPQAVSDVGWADYLFMRTNPKGTLREQWCCTSGCGQWFKVERNSVSLEVTETLRFDERFSDREPA
jgi:sarcosine oxidase subunit delta